MPGRKFNVIFAIVSTVLMVVVVVTHCSPVSAYWRQFDSYLHPHKPVAYCEIAPNTQFKVALLVGLVNDFSVWLLPVFEVTFLMRRQSRREENVATENLGKRRVGYILLFGTGLVACTAELARVIIAFVSSVGDKHPECEFDSFDRLLNNCTKKRAHCFERVQTKFPGIMVLADNSRTAAITKFVVSSISLYLLAIVCACTPPSAPIWVSVWRSTREIMPSLFGRKQLERQCWEEAAEPVTRSDHIAGVGAAAERESQPKGACIGGARQGPSTVTTDESGGWSWSTRGTNGLDAEDGNELMELRSVL